MGSKSRKKSLDKERRRIKNLHRRGQRVAASRRAAVTRQEQALSVRAQVSAFRAECLKYIDFRNDLRASVDTWRREIEKLLEKNHDRAAQVLSDGLKKVEAKFSSLDAAVEKIREAFTGILDLETTDERLAYTLDNYEVVETARGLVFEILDDVEEIKARYDRVLAGKEPIEDLDANSDPDIQYPVDDETTPPVGICAPSIGKTKHEIERDDAMDRAWVGARLDMAAPDALNMEQYKELSNILDEWATEQIAKENAEIRAKYEERAANGDEQAIKLLKEHPDFADGPLPVLDPEVISANQLKSNEPEVVPQIQDEAVMSENKSTDSVDVSEIVRDIYNGDTIIVPRNIPGLSDAEGAADENKPAGSIDPSEITRDIYNNDVTIIPRNIPGLSDSTIEDLGVVETKTVEPDPVKTGAAK